MTPDPGPARGLTPAEQVVRDALTETERVPWPFPGPYYDWTTDDELGSLVGQVRQHAQHAGGTRFAESLTQIAADIQRVRALIPGAAQIPPEGIS